MRLSLSHKEMCGVLLIAEYANGKGSLLPTLNARKKLRSPKKERKIMTIFRRTLIEN